MNILTKLKLIRLEKGLSQHEVEAKSGIYQSLISLYERGLKVPPQRHRETLAKLYQKPEEELFDGKQN